ncbi:MAG: hypothetical protein HYX52_07480 [Chloroflexi bacterium]|nr:hypothetical protein [Chloroflexota bacterium]
MAAHEGRSADTLTPPGTMSYQNDDLDTFASTRRALLEMIEQSEQQLRERKAHVIRQAEERAREIVGEAEHRALEVDQQLADLEQQIAEARARLVALRVRASGNRSAG